METIKAGIQQSLLLMFTGVLMGVIAGWYNVLTGDDSGDSAAAFAQASVPFFAACALLFPAGLAFQVYRDVKGQLSAHYTPFRRALAQLLIAALAGSLAGFILFVGAAGQIPAIFGNSTAVDIVLALYPAIGWGLLLTVTSVTVLAAVLLALWSQRAA